MAGARVSGGAGHEAIEALLRAILVDAHGDDEQLWSFRTAFEAQVPLPADAFVIGEPVTVVAIEYAGNPRRGLTARCRRENGAEYTVPASELLFAEGSSGARYVAAYRKWLGLDPMSPAEAGAPGPRRHKADEQELDLGAPIDLVALAIREAAVRCRILGSGREITLRSTGTWNVAPGEIVTVRASKSWRYAGHPYLSGAIESCRLEVAALQLVPLRLRDHGTWDPAEEYWGENGEPREEWARPIMASGPRPSFEMEQVRPGADPEEPFDDPILQAIDLHRVGDPLGARKLLMDMLAADLRCLDAHAHLGNFAFHHLPKEAIRHCEAGLRIGELSFGDGFDGVLSWDCLDNRPFLRCLHGYGLCLWRLGRADEATAVFERMLRLNPVDNQGARFLLPEVRPGVRWEDSCGKDDKD
jgi:hypothetical protein